MPKVIFKDKKVFAEVAQGVSILEIAMDHGVPLYHTCGGNCSCSTCRVLVLKGGENLSPIEADEAQILDAFDLKPPHRLGCQATALGGEVEVEIPRRDKAPRASRIPPLPET